MNGLFWFTCATTLGSAVVALFMAFAAWDFSRDMDCPGEMVVSAVLAVCFGALTVWGIALLW